jgi:hypothetical protein
MPKFNNIGNYLFFPFCYFSSIIKHKNIVMKIKLTQNVNFQQLKKHSPFIVKLKPNQSKLRFFACASKSIPFVSKVK